MLKSKVYNTMLEDPFIYSEFLSCYINHGIEQVLDIYEDSQNFAFYVTPIMSHSVIYMKTESSEFFERTIREFNKNNYEMFVITENLREDLTRDGWNCRHQFYTEKEFKTITIPTDHVHIYPAGKESADRVAAVGDSRLLEKYQLGIDYDDMKMETWLIDVSGVPVSGCILVEYGPSDLPYGMKEVAWIYTKNEYREKGYAKKLLAAVCAAYAGQNVRVTYHCDHTNRASYATARSVGLRQLCDIYYKDFMSSEIGAL